MNIKAFKLIISIFIMFLAIVIPNVVLILTVPETIWCSIFIIELVAFGFSTVIAIVILDITNQG